MTDEVDYPIRTREGAKKKSRILFRVPAYVRRTENYTYREEEKKMLRMIR